MLDVVDARLVAVDVAVELRQRDVVVAPPLALVCAGVADHDRQVVRGAVDRVRVEVDDARGVGQRREVDRRRAGVVVPPPGLGVGAGVGAGLVLSVLVLEM